METLPGISAFSFALNMASGMPVAPFWSFMTNLIQNMKRLNQHVKKRLRIRVIHALKNRA